MDAVVSDIQKHKIKLVIIACDASEKSKENVKYVCTNNKISVIEFSTMEELGKTIGKEKRAIIGIKDKNFSEGIVSKIDFSIKEIKNNGGDLL